MAAYMQHRTSWFKLLPMLSSVLCEYYKLEASGELCVCELFGASTPQPEPPPLGHYKLFTYWAGPFSHHLFCVPLNWLSGVLSIISARNILISHQDSCGRGGKVPFIYKPMFFMGLEASWCAFNIKIWFKEGTSRRPARIVGQISNLEASYALFHVFFFYKTETLLNLALICCLKTVLI